MTNVSPMLRLIELQLRHRDIVDNQVAADDEGQVALSSPSPYTDQDEDRVALLDTELPQPTNRRPRKRSGCCMCCGVE